MASYNGWDSFNSDRLDFLAIFLAPSEIQEKVRIWRNDKRVNDRMLDQHYIYIKEHQDWIQKLKQQTDKLVYIVFDDEEPLGVVNFEFRPGQLDANWGIYLNPDLKQSGIGARITRALFNQMWYFSPDLQWINARIKPSNVASIYMHLQVGFRKNELQNSPKELIFYTLTKEQFKGQND